MKTTLLVIGLLALSGCVSVKTEDLEYSRFSPWGGSAIVAKRDKDGGWRIEETEPADPNTGLLELLLRQRGLGAPQ